jgi:translation initiation factor IF-2
MFDFLGQKVEEAGPSTPVTILGLKEVPQAGDLFRVVDKEKDARIIVAEREQKLKDAKKISAVPLTLETMFDAFQAGQVRELRLIVKADVQGSLEPIVTSLGEMSATDKEGDIGVKILHSGTGNIGENDVTLASASQAIVMGFNVESDEAAHRMAERDGIAIRHYNIIYRLTEDVEKALKGMLEPEERETVIGKAEVRAVFKASKIGKIAGCRVVEGEVRRKAFVRVMRKGKLVHEGEIKSLKQEKNDAKEVREGFECGITLKDYNEIAEGDILEAYIKELVPAA